MLPDHLFRNPAWHALQTVHRDLAISAGDACRYPAEVTPYAAVSAPTGKALRDLYGLLESGDAVWLVGGPYPLLEELEVVDTLVCLQMALPDHVPLEPPSPDLVPLAGANAAEMVALTDLAFPGFFRPQTHRMGRYYGIRHAGELIAMAGERLQLPGYPEISGVCTHPEHRGKGLAAGLIRQLMLDHRRDGLTSWLHVAGTNQRAIDLYLRLGFVIAREAPFTQVTRRV